MHNVNVYNVFCVQVYARVKKSGGGENRTKLRVQASRERGARCPVKSSCQKRKSRVKENHAIKVRYKVKGMRIHLALRSN